MKSIRGAFLVCAFFSASSASVCSSTDERPGVYVDLFAEGRWSGSGVRKAFHDAIVLNQQPADCLSRKMCTCKSSHGQLFSELHGEVTCLLQAVLRNCTLTHFMGGGHDPVPAKEPLSNPNECKSQQLRECYLQPLSTCDKSLGETFDASQIGLDEDDRVFAQIERRWGIRGRLAVMSELIGYSFRPRRRVKQMVVQLAKMLQLGDCPGDTALNATGALHIRHGDKVLPRMHKGQITSPGSTSFSDTGQYAALASQAARVYGLAAMHLMSDDPDVPEAIQRAMKRGGGNVRVTSVPANMVILAHKGQEQEEAQKIVRENQTARTVDQLTLLLAEAILMAQSSILIGPLVSNVDRAISELMGLVHWPVVMLNPDNDLFVAGATSERHNGPKWTLGKSEQGDRVSQLVASTSNHKTSPTTHIPINNSANRKKTLSAPKKNTPL